MLIFQILALFPILFFSFFIKLLFSKFKLFYNLANFEIYFNLNKPIVVLIKQFLIALN